MSTSTSQANGSNPSVTELVSGIVGDVQDLGRQHLELFRHEVKEDFRKASDAAASLAIGLAFAQIGGILICLGLAHLLAFVAPGIPLWGCYLIVGGVIAIGASIAVIAGIRKFKSVEKLSNQAAEIMKDDAKWLSQPK